MIRHPWSTYCTERLCIRTQINQDSSFISPLCLWECWKDNMNNLMQWEAFKLLKKPAVIMVTCVRRPQLLQQPASRGLKNSAEVTKHLRWGIHLHQSYICWQPEPHLTVKMKSEIWISSTSQELIRHDAYSLSDGKFRRQKLPCQAWWLEEQLGGCHTLAIPTPFKLQFIRSLVFQSLLWLMLHGAHQKVPLLFTTPAMK